jgi:two-component system CheB/CheR fusion protein
MLGYSLEELKTMQLIKLVHPDDLAENLALKKSVIENKSEQLVVKNRYVKKNGESVWVRKSMTITQDEEGDHLWFMIVENIDSRVRAQERYEFDWHVAEKLAQAGFWEWDLETNTDYWSEETWRLCGLEPGNAKPSFETWLSAVHPDDREQAANKTLEAGKNGSEICTEWRLANSEPPRYLVSRGRPIRNERGEIVRYMGLIFDITAQKKIEAELQIARDAAEAANRAKSEFLANMSHEIRTPLTSIMLMADLLNRPGKERKARFERYGDIIQGNSKLLVRLINDILDLSKIEAGKIQLEIESTNIRELLSDIATSMRFLATTRGLEFSITVDKDVPDQILIDPTRFKQILLNIIGNAVKFTDKGTITVTVNADPERKYLRINVSDTGVGLTDQQAKKLFEPFAQADASTTRKFGGTGLGLVLSRRCAEALGGDVRLLEYQEGRGCTFEITVGLREVEPGHDTASVEDNSQTRIDGVRVLVAEDTSDIQILLQEFITMAGGVVDIAKDGAEALEKASTGVYDIVLMDIGMPKMDGYTAARRLREQKFSAPIVALTAHSMREEIQRCLESGCNAHLAKPLQWDDLIQSIQRLTRQRPA